MPFMSGIDATKQMRAFFETKLGLDRLKQPKIVGVTGHATEKYHLEGI